MASTTINGGITARHPDLRARLVGLACHVLRRLAGFRAYRVLTLAPADIPERFRADRCTLPAQVLQGDDLARVAGRHRDLGRKFIDRSMAKGDWCLAYFDGKRLASYGWYSAGTTRVGDHFAFEFPEDYVYMYRGYTLRNYRGARLHGYGMAAAARAVVDDGRRGLVSLVEVQNTASLRSAARTGYRRAGTLFTARLFGWPVTLGTPACRRIGCRLVSIPNDEGGRRR